MALMEKCEELKRDEDKTIRSLTSASKLVLLLVSLSSQQMLPKDVSLLESVLLPTVTSEQVSHQWFIEREGGTGIPHSFGLFPKKNSVRPSPVCVCV